MPRTVKIGPYRYSLLVDDAAVAAQERASNDSIDAFTSLAKHEMRFSSAAHQPVSVIHEVLHALFDLTGANIRLGSEREEDVIQSIDHLIVALLQENPALIRYLVESESAV